MYPLARILFLFLFTSCATIPSPGEAPATGKGVHHLGVLVGARSFDEDDFAPVEDQTAYGVEYTGYYSPTAHVGLTVGVQHSSDDGSDFDPLLGSIDVEATVDELYIGAQIPILLPAKSPVVPYVGAGVAYRRGDLELDSPNFGSLSEDDSAPGAYAHAGVRWTILQHLVLGLDLRATFSEDFEIGGVDFDGDYTQVAGYLGFAF